MLKHGDLFLLQMILKTHSLSFNTQFVYCCPFVVAIFFSASKDDQGQSTRSGDLNQMQIKT